MIGKLEEIVLLAALKVGPNALPSAIYEQIVATTQSGAREPAFGAVYTTITRMADKKMMIVGSSIDAKGRERRTFSVSAAGQTALRAGVKQSYALGALALAGGSL